MNTIPKYLWLMNPCRRCIVRACCSSVCLEYIRLSGKIEDMTIKLLIPLIVCVVFYDEVKGRIMRWISHVKSV